MIMQYTVEAGDSLSTIARDILGDLTRWQEIAQRNGLASPYVIYAGQVLDLPDPGTISYGPATAVVPATPIQLPDWVKSPWALLGIGVGLWWFTQR
jgi:LysM repeat protein